jgi:hypothetical protein
VAWPNERMDLWRRPIHKKPLVNLIRGADLLPMNVGKRVVGQGLGHAPLDQIGRRVHLGGAQVVDDRSRLPIGRVPALLGMDSLEHMAHLADLGRRHVAEDIPVEMHHAALPSRLWQVLSRALHQAAAGIRNDQLHAREAAIDNAKRSSE